MTDDNEPASQFYDKWQKQFLQAPDLTEMFRDSAAEQSARMQETNRQFEAIARAKRERREQEDADRARTVQLAEQQLQIAEDSRRIAQDSRDAAKSSLSIAKWALAVAVIAVLVAVVRFSLQPSSRESSTSAKSERQ